MFLRVFERGGKRRLEVGLPDKEEDPGKPDKGLSARGFGTAQRTDPVFLGIQKTRLLDPTLNFLGTNDHPGDYRSSGCSACHVIYANDRDPSHSAFYQQAGNLGRSQTADPSIPKTESGHPIKHQFTSQIPTSQCMVCHMHPGTNMVASYLGLTWWDNESDGAKMYPATQHNPSQDEEQEKLDRNPEGASMRGLWSGFDFLKDTGTASFNALLRNTQFADFHGHGWMFRKVFKRDRKGNLLDAQGNIVSPDDPAKFEKAVHLNDIHLERGMHCVDCHFRQDSHGDGNLYNEPRAAIEIACEDCHGTIQKKASLFTSGPAAAVATGTAAERRKTQNQPLAGQDLTRIRVRDAEGTRIPLFQRVTRDRKRKDEKGVDVDLKTRRHHAELDGCARTLVACAADSRYRHGRQSRLQREVELREDDAQRQRDVGRRSCGQQSTGPSRREHDVCCVSLFVGDELFRMSPLDAGESQDAKPSQRRRQHAQLHAIQLSGSTRRHLHARS